MINYKTAHEILKNFNINHVSSTCEDLILMIGYLKFEGFEFRICASRWSGVQIDLGKVTLYEYNFPLTKYFTEEYKIMRDHYNRLIGYVAIKSMQKKHNHEDLFKALDAKIGNCY